MPSESDEPLTESLTVGSLFSGIGGLDLGLERAGMRVVWQSEIDPYASRVLAKHWPTIPNLGDITQVDWTHVQRPDLICGGYPCQPFSLAGQRGGESDPRHLWPHMRDAIRLLRPRFAVLENVPGHLAVGFGRVLGDLAELGYDCEWDCIPAAAVGAPHLRYRVFVVAADTRCPERWRGAERGSIRDGQPGVHGAAGTVAHTGRGRRPADELSAGRDIAGIRGTDVADTEVDAVGWWALEPDVGRVAHGVSHRVDRLRCLGNAVVPQVAEWIGRRIVEAA